MKNVLKKIMVLMLIALMLIGMTACGLQKADNLQMKTVLQEKKKPSKSVCHLLYGGTAQYG